MKLIKIITLLVVIFIASCSSANPTSELTNQPTVQGDGSSYPAPVNEPSSAYPAGEPEVVLPPAPTIDPSLGMVKGILLLQGKPVVNADLYLAGIILDENGKDVAAVMDRPTSPRTRTDAQGNFTFVNLSAGTYGIVIDTVLDSFVLLEPGSENQIRLQVTQGQTTDMGELNFDDLPVN
jgi:ABC-type phosphate transport system substrate-binding protein